jgi:hypothetical protein
LLKLEALSLQLLELPFQPLGRLPIGQCVNKPINLSADPSSFAAHMAKMRACLCLKPVPFGGELSREDFEQSWVHEPLTQSVHNCRLERIPADRQAIRANRLALVACGRATEMRLADLGEAVNGAAIFLKSGAAKFPSLAGLGCQPCG